MVLRERVNRALMLKGVSLQNPPSIFIDPRCHIAAEVRIESGCQIIQSDIGPGTVIEAGCRIVESQIAGKAHIKQGSYLEKSQVGEKSVWDLMPICAPVHTSNKK